MPPVYTEPLTARDWLAADVLVELGALMLVSAVVQAWPGLRSALARLGGSLADRLASSQRRFLVGIALLSFAGSALRGILVRMPTPWVHDEYSYLLAGETFAAGRMTNPTPPCPEHFETMHVLVRPTYMSKYPPAQGLAIALGLRLAGEPALGVWISTAVAVAAAAWALFGWLPPRWAVLASTLVLLRAGFAGPWAQSFFGGSVAMLGGALVLGALPRLAARPRVATSLALGLGLGVLASSRPWEGLLAAAAGLPWLALRLWRSRPGRDAILRGAIPAGLVLAAFATAHLAYNRAVTGRATLMPYQAYQNQYMPASPFLWIGPRSMPDLPPSILRDYLLGDFSIYQRQRSLRGLLSEFPGKLRVASRFPFGALVALPLLALPALAFHRKSRVALATCALFTASTLGIAYMQSHYAAPQAAAGFLLVIQATRLLRTRRRLFRGLPTALLAASAGFASWHAVKDDGMWSARLRARLEERLLEEPGKDLVIVEYSKDYDPTHEWIYNHPDFEGAEVLWARHLGREADARLVQQFPGRTAWVLHVDSTTCEAGIEMYAP